MATNSRLAGFHQISSEFWPSPIAPQKFVPFEGYGVTLAQQNHLSRLITLLLLKGSAKRTHTGPASRLVSTILKSVPKAIVLVIAAGTLFFALRSIIEEDEEMNTSKE